MAGPETRNKVSLINRSPGTWHDECSAVSRPQLTPTDDQRNGNAHISQVGQRLNVKALEGNHGQLEGNSDRCVY